MILDADELAELARFCARRFPDPDDRARVAREAGLALPDDPSWYALLAQAQRSGRLAHLARGLSHAAPTDENLRAAAQLLTPPPSRVPALLALGLAGALGCGLLMVGAVTVALASGGAGEAAPVREEARPVSAAVEEAPVAEVPVGDVPVAEVPVAEVPVVEVQVAQVPVAAPEPQTGVEEGSLPAPAGEAPTFGCSGEAGAVLGYWYAGSDDPGAGPLTLPTDARVRADYPRKENRHNARAAERCVLPRGTTVTPQHAPIHVAGNRWWVPFTAGDVAG